MFDWTLTRSFLAVVKTGSLSAAANELAASQPTIGRHISELEAQLGVTLFDRTPRGFTPTESALNLIPHAQEMERAAAMFSLQAAGTSQTLDGTVRITASEVVATYILPEIIAKFMAQEPKIEIEIAATNTNENLLLREADIAIRMQQPTQADVIAKKIGDLELGLFAHESYLAGRPTPTGLTDFQDHLFVGYDRSEMIIQGMRSFGFNATRHDFRFRTDNQVTYLEAIAAGVGLGAAMVAAISHRHGLARVLPELEIPPLPMWLAAHKQLKSSARVRRVYDFLGEELKSVCM